MFFAFYDTGKNSFIRNFIHLILCACMFFLYGSYAWKVRTPLQCNGVTVRLNLKLKLKFE